MSGVRLECAVDDLDPVAGPPRWRCRFADHAARPVFETDRDVIALARFHPLLDLVAGHRSAYRADNRGDLLPAAAANLVAENAAHGRSADRAEAGSFPLGLNLAHRFDHAALGAPCLGRRVRSYLPRRR